MTYGDAPANFYTHHFIIHSMNGVVLYQHCGIFLHVAVSLLFPCYSKRAESRHYVSYSGCSMRYLPTAWLREIDVIHCQRRETHFHIILPVSEYAMIVTFIRLNNSVSFSRINWYITVCQIALVDTGPYRWWVNIGSSICMVLSGNIRVYEPMFTKTSNVIWSDKFPTSKTKSPLWLKLIFIPTNTFVELMNSKCKFK